MFVCSLQVGRVLIGRFFATFTILLIRFGGQNEEDNIDDNDTRRPSIGDGDIGVRGCAGPVAGAVGGFVGCDRRRGGAQRSDVCGLPGAGGPAGAGSRSPAAGWRCLHAPGSLAGVSDLAVCLPGRAPPPAGDRRAGDGGLRVPVDCRPEPDCSFRSRMARASSSGTTMSFVRRRSGGWRRATWRGGVPSGM